jgi:4-hydroxybenzoyl-CoA thioesterase
MFRNSHSITIEWGDCDPAGIVFYPRYFAMFDAATAFLLESASGLTRAQLIAHYGILGWPMVDTRAVFLKPASFDDRIVIDTEVTRLGRSSFDVAHRLMKDSVLCVEATETRVWARRKMEPDGIESIPLPAELRANLERSD